LTLTYQRSNLKCRSKIHSTTQRCDQAIITAKISDCTLKPTRETHSVLQQCTTAKTVCTDVSLNASSRAQVCAWNMAKPGLPYRNNKGGKGNQNQNSAGHSCRNTLRLCVNGLPITRFRALQVCAWNVAHPALVDINKQRNKTHSALEHSCSQLQKHESSRVHTVCAWNGAGWKVQNYLSSFFVIFPCSPHLENVTSCSVSQGARRTPLHTQSISHC